MIVDDLCFKALIWKVRRFGLWLELKSSEGRSPGSLVYIIKKKEIISLSRILCLRMMMIIIKCSDMTVPCTANTLEIDVCFLLFFFFRNLNLCCRGTGMSLSA